MDVTLALLADYANVTKEGKLNVMGIFSVINVPSLPHTHPQMQLILELEAGPAEWDMEKDVEVKLLDADGNAKFGVRGNVKIPRGEAGKPVRLNSAMTIGNLKFDAEGDYVFAILVGGETKKQIPFRVNYVPLARPPDAKT